MPDSKSKKSSSKKNTTKSSFNMDEMTLFPKRADWRNKTLPDGTKVTSAMPHPKALEKIKESAKTIQSETKVGRPYSNAANQARRVGAVNKHIVQPGGLAKFARRASIPGMVVAGALYGYNKYQDSKSSNAKPTTTNSSAKPSAKPTSNAKQDSTVNKPKVRAVNPNYVPGGNKKAKGGKLNSANTFKCGGKMKKK